MTATTPSAPLLFLPSQHHHQHQHQFVPQHVQLFPAGVVYQPLGSCIYGQPSPIMMPAGFLGTVMHPGDQSVINRLDSSSAQTGSASKGEAIGTATLPKVSEKDKIGRLGTKPITCTGYKGAHVPPAAGLSKPGFGKMCGSNVQQIMRNPGISHQLAHAASRSGIQMASVHPNVVPAGHNFTCKHPKDLLGSEGSGSDESMNSTSVNTKDSLENEKDSQFNSDNDGPLWVAQARSDNAASCPAEVATAAASTSRPKPTRNKQPPWLENVKVTPDLMYRYRIPAGDLSDVLQKDLEALKIFGKQSSMVNDQLGMLYNELNLEGSPGIALNLEEGLTSSSGDENAKDNVAIRKTKRSIQSHRYSKMVILYEENAPFPPETEVAVPKSEAEV